MTTSITSAASYLGDTQSAQSSSKLADDLDTFLTLLTTQLKNQDPLSPMDSTEFTNQLVQFSAVEQSIYTNENLESMISLQTQSMASNAINYMGETVQISSDYVQLQDGVGKFTYTLSDEADSVSVVVQDSSGAIVRSFEAETSSGLHTVEWDGMDNYGLEVEDGAYEITVTAVGGDDTVDVATTSFGRVTGVGSDDNGIYIGVGDIVVNLEDILTVREAVTLTETEETTDTETDTETDSESETDGDSESETETEET